MAWCHVFAHADQVRSVPYAAVVDILKKAGFAAGDEVALGRITAATVGALTPTGSTWAEVNARALHVRASLAAPASDTLPFVVHYEALLRCELLTPPPALLKGLFTFSPQPRERTVFYARADRLLDILNAAAVVAGGVELVAHASRTSELSDHAVKAHFTCLFSGKPGVVADDADGADGAVGAPGGGAGGGAGAGDDNARRDARRVAAQAHAAHSTSTRTGGPLALGCSGSVVIYVPPTESGALSIAVVSHCTVRHDGEHQTEAHFALHPYVRHVISNLARVGEGGRAINSATPSKLQNFYKRVLEVEVQNAHLILDGYEPNVRYPDYFGGLPTFTYADKVTLGSVGKYVPLATAGTLPPAPPPPSPAAGTTLCSCAQLTSVWLGDDAEPIIVCADPRCSIVRFHRACVAVGLDVLGARGAGEDEAVDDDGAEPDAVIAMRWRCATCKSHEPVQCVCGGAGAPLDADTIQCTAMVPPCVEWYHMSCVGVDEDDDTTGDWACPACSEAAAEAAAADGDE